jgi:hypothetical protein
MTELSQETRQYLAKSYPSNHCYRFLGQRIIPGWSLFRRWRRISALYPRPLTSFIDLSVCKGYFVIQAASAGVPRVMGVDVDEGAVRVTGEVLDYLGLDQVDLRVASLEEVAAATAESGQPFQTALLVNTYQYLSFGSPMDTSVRSNDEIFGLLRSICDGVLLFSNCLTFEELPPGVQRRVAEEGFDASGYNPTAIRQTAENYFEIEEAGYLGKRPFWRMTARPDAPDLKN